jgi:hypothetical protein
MGNSFGGIETVLGASHGAYCAAVDAAGGAESWDEAPGLRDVVMGRRAKRRDRSSSFRPRTT